MAEQKRYPGRSRVMHRDDARDALWRQWLRSEHGPGERFPCERPYILPAIGLPGYLEPDRSKLPLEVSTRCRKCPGCLEHRRRLWTARAVDEVKASSRTWFGTLTVRPEDRFRLRMIADVECHTRRQEPLSSQSDAEQFKLSCGPLHAEATKFLKRIRAESCARLRYLLVTEKHKSGDAHLHILLHEQDVAIPKALLERQWRLGFSHWRLCDRDEKAAVYACKYLAKEALTRVRASARYGQAHLVRRITERLEEVRDAVNEAKRSGTGATPAV